MPEEATRFAEKELSADHGFVWTETGAACRCDGWAVTTLPNRAASLSAHGQHGQHVIWTLREQVEALAEALRTAERVCALVGWTGTGSTEREKALTQVWMEWSDSRPGMSNPDAWPDLDDASITALAAQRDATREATLARLPIATEETS